MKTATLMLAISLFQLHSYAEVLQPGRVRIRQAFGVATYSSLWAGEKSKTIGIAPESTTSPTSGEGSGVTSATSQNSGNVTSFLSDTSVSFGVGYKLQLDANLIYQYSKLTGADEGGREDGDFVGGVSEIGFRVKRELVSTWDPGKINYGVNGYVGVRAPGNAPADSNDFLAINDGSTKYDLGVTAGIRFDQFSFENDLKFVIRTGDEQGSQLQYNLFVPLSFFESVTFGPFVTFLTTFSGLDIGSDEFKAIAEANGGTKPFSLVKEQYLSLGLFGAIPVTDILTLDLSVQKKILGRNTDKALTFAVGLSIGF